MEQLGKRTLCVNLRIYPLVGANQRSMRVWHAAKSTPNATSAIRALGVDSAFWHLSKSTQHARPACCQINTKCAFWHLSGFQPRFSSVGATSRSRAGAPSYRMSEATSHGEYQAYSPKCAWR